MPHAIDAEVITRQGNTVHENIDEKINRVSNSLWQVLAEERRIDRSSEFQDEQKIFVVLKPADRDHYDAPHLIGAINLAGQTLISLSRFSEALSSLDEASKAFGVFSDFLQQGRKDRTFTIGTRASSDTSTLVSWLRGVRHSKEEQHAKLGSNFDEAQWNNDKNVRRCLLVDKEIARTLSQSEKVELEQLQEEMLDYRRKVAPLPLEDLRKFHAELLREVGNKPE